MSVCLCVLWVSMRSKHVMNVNNVLMETDVNETIIPAIFGSYGILVAICALCECLCFVLFFVAACLFRGHRGWH